jgi:hypothetical protein
MVHGYEPEQMRYTASLTIAHADPQRSEDVYAFIPGLRYQPVSSLARCSETSGMDFTPDDYPDGFDENLTRLKSNISVIRKILAFLISDMPGGYGRLRDAHGVAEAVLRKMVIARRLCDRCKQPS